MRAVANLWQIWVAADAGVLTPYSLTPSPFPSQVDCHYLQLYLWRFVADEAVVQQVLEEGLDVARTTLWAATWQPSSLARVTSVKSLSSLSCLKLVRVLF